MGLKARLVRGATWSVIGSSVTVATILASNLLLARVLRADDYGGVLIIQSTVATAAFALGLGLSNVATRYAAELEVRPNGAAQSVIRSSAHLLTWSAMAYGTLAAIVCVLLPSLAPTQALEVTLPVVGAALAALLLDAFLKGILIGAGRMKHFAFATIIGSTSIGAGLAIGAVTAGPGGALCGWTAGASTQLLVSALFLRTHSEVDRPIG